MKVKPWIKISALTALYLTLAFGALAQTGDITEQPDTALGVTLFAPKKVKSVAVNQGLLKMDRISWRVYPIIYQSMDKTNKQAALQIDILGPLNGGFTNATLAVNIDGQVVSAPVTWTEVNTIFGDNAVSTKIALREETGSFRRLAAAKDVYLTVLLQGRLDRYTVHLTGEYLAVFRTMLGEYDALEPRDMATK
jgi:hypothetical protein